MSRSLTPVLLVVLQQLVAGRYQLELAAALHRIIMPDVEAKPIKSMAPFSLQNRKTPMFVLSIAPTSCL